MSCCSCLTPHEEVLRRVANGEKDPNSAKHARMFKLADRFVGKTPIIDIERGLYFTQSMKETEGEELVLRWAKGLMNIAKNITVYIDDDQLIVGRIGSDKGRYGILYPELDGDFFAEVLEKVSGRTDGALLVSPEDVVTSQNEISPYWQGKTLHEDIVRHLPDECKRLSYNDEKGRDPRFIAIECASQRAGTNWCPDYKKVIDKGLKWVKEEAQRHLDELDMNDPEVRIRKKPFYEAIILTADAIILWVHRHAALAREKAAVCTDPVRKAELLKIAEHCEWVPENPARTFWEALQCQWFIQLFSRLEHRSGGVVTNGRYDQYLYPLFKADKEAGILDDDKALELLDCVWCNIAQFIDISITPVSAKVLGGYASWETICIGGMDQHGQDATNELSYLILESRKASPLTHPELSVRVHSRTPDRFLKAIAETIKVGQGFPKLMNDHEIINHFVSLGATFQDALDYTNSGCTEIRIINKDWNTSPTTQFNYPAFVELTMYNGRMLKHGDELLTFESGDPCSFATWEEFFEAFKSQLTYGLVRGFMNQYWVNRLRERHFATPMADGLHDLCMKYAKDLQSCDPVPGCIDSCYFNLFGFATTIDSLAAIKQCVYDEKCITMEELLTALRADFVGYEDLQRKLASCHAYGNGDPYADEIGLELDRISQEFAIKYEKSVGCHMSYRMVPVTGFIPHGAEVSASANGRRAYTPLSEGCSASHGADRTGPTGVLISNSNTKNFGMGHYAARLLNLKLTPNLVKGEEGTRNLMAFIRTFLDLKLWHVQFNIINRDTMLAAQKEPEKFKNLIVRVAGYSAFFVDLSKAIQDEVIYRTEHENF